MDPDLASFVFKFQDICSTGKNATLTFSSLTGKVYVNLSLEIGSVKAGPKFPVPCVTSPPVNTRHVSPSKRRRMNRRAESRRLFAEKAKYDLSTEELSVLVAAEKAVDNHVNTNKVEESIEASNDSHVTQNEASCQVNMVQAIKDCENDPEEDVEEIDIDELEKDRLVSEILIYAVPPSDCRIPMQGVNEVQQEIREKFSTIGAKIEDMKVKASSQGKFESSLVIITPTNLRKIWGRRLGLLNCAVVEYKQQDSF